MHNHESWNQDNSTPKVSVCPTTINISQLSVKCRSISLSLSLSLSLALSLSLTWITNPCHRLSVLHHRVECLQEFRLMPHLPIRCPFVLRPVNGWNTNDCKQNNAFPVHWLHGLHQNSFSIKRQLRYGLCLWCRAFCCFGSYKWWEAATHLCFNRLVYTRMHRVYLVPSHLIT